MPIDKEKFEKKLKAIDSFVLKEDFTKGFKVLFDFVKSVVRNLNKRYTETINKIDNKIVKAETDISQMLNAQEAKIAKKLSEIKDGEKGDIGDTPTDEVLINLINPLIPAPLNGADGSPDTPKLIRDKLEFLEADQRLDISAIRGLRKRLTKLEERPLGGKGGGGLSYISLDQHFFEDEVPTNSGDNKTFTLSTSPNPVNSLHLYRGGARQQLNPTGTTDGDFSLSGNTITLNVDLVSGEIILCDFRA